MDGSYLMLLSGILAAGVALISGLGLADRRSSRRAAQSPPPPLPDNTDAPIPDYLPVTTALRASAPTPHIDVDELRRTLSDAHQVDAHLAEPAFAHVEAYAVIEDAAVAVLTASPQSLRELLGIFEHAQGSPLVLVAPAFGDTTVIDLLANHRQGLLSVYPVIADDPTSIATLVGAEPIDELDLHSGYVARLGHATRWVSDSRHSWCEVSTLTSE
ncbi:MAG: hypothetical protein ACRCWS_07460 [Propionibacteriaceae bacterium]